MKGNITMTVNQKKFVNIFDMMQEITIKLGVKVLKDLEKASFDEFSLEENKEGKIRRIFPSDKKIDESHRYAATINSVIEDFASDDPNLRMLIAARAFANVVYDAMNESDADKHNMLCYLYLGLMLNEFAEIYSDDTEVYDEEDEDDDDEDDDDEEKDSSFFADLKDDELDSIVTESNDNGENDEVEDLNNLINEDKNRDSKEIEKEYNIINYVGLLDGDKGDYSIVFPDLPDCTAGGDTITAVTSNAVLAVKEWLLDNPGGKIPLASDMMTLKENVEVAEALRRGAAFVTISVNIDRLNVLSTKEGNDE
jgi:predicted RNase H-like HicB family nuclease